MNYYRRYVGSYLKKTTKITMIEDGAYTRLLDTYYADEKPLNPAEAYTIARAMSSAERKAVDAVVTKYFYLGADGMLHNEKADEELGVAVPKIAKQREIGKLNGSKGGRPQKTKIGSGIETNAGSEEKPSLVPGNNQTYTQPSTVSHQPESNPPSEKQRLGGRHPPDSAATLGAAVLEKTKALTLDQAKIEGGEDTPAAVLASVLNANGIKGNSFHPIVADWAREGITVDRLKKAIAKGRQRPGKDAPGALRIEYLDTFVRDDEKPKGKPWKSDDAEAEALCQRLGIKGAKVNEQRDAWHQRIETALAEHARSRVA